MHHGQTKVRRGSLNISSTESVATVLIRGEEVMTEIVPKETRSQFEQIDPLMISVNGRSDPTEVACIERDPRWEKHQGEIWINDNWLDRDAAAALRDWLSDALEGS